MATIKGQIKAISVSATKGTPKMNVFNAELRTDYGIVGDAHAGNGYRQISLLSYESIAEVVAKGVELSPGDFAENITSEGIDLKDLKIGDKLSLNDKCELEITQFGEHCHGRCLIYERLNDSVIPREGIFAKVTKGSFINVGDQIIV